MASILRDAGYELQEELSSTQESELNDHIEYKPVSLIVVGQGEGLPSIATLRQQLETAEKAIPILAIVDNLVGPAPVAALQAGADNCILLQEPQHLIAVVTKELQQAHLCRQARSLKTRLQEVEARCDNLLDHSREAIAYIHEGVHVNANPAYLALFGFANKEDIRGLPLLNLIRREDHDPFKRFLRQVTRAGRGKKPLEVRTLTHMGQEFTSRIECTPTRMNDEPCMQIQVEEVPEPAEAVSRQIEERIREFGKYEPVTGLYNRKYFSEFLDDIRADRGGGAVLYILLSSYRFISEEVGLEAVDLLVSELAGVIKESLTENDVIARFSDAVFTVYTQSVVRKELQELGDKLHAAIKNHTSHAHGRLVTTGACIGICQVRSSHKSARQILIHADRACETARQAGGDQVRIYSPSTSTSGMASEEGQLLLKLKDAISDQRLELSFQPIASFQDGATERYKAFLRILDENQKVLDMGKLLPLAESRGLMRPLDKWVIARGLEILTQRYQSGRVGTVIFINVSSNSVVDEGFFPWLGQSLSDTGLSGSSLVLEVTEEVAEHYFKQMQAFGQRLHSLQCGLALSHFGGKPHSQRLLQHLRPDFIKLDGVLIEQLAKGKEEEPRIAMAAITEQAQAMQTQIVAASVSNAAQMAGIWQFGVTLVQGDMVQEASPYMEFDFSQFAG
ncbi:MAG: EAL domain-containing protein [Gammaproteobacteria bacterium]|nr:EAL domain-containing protein [Gammaproteobacteria bacterium]MCP5458829.1 EAL domain-containing protein [Gammaproteobacteria bacterium]